MQVKCKYENTNVYESIIWTLKEQIHLEERIFGTGRQRTTNGVTFLNLTEGPSFLRNPLSVSTPTGSDTVASEEEKDDEEEEEDSLKGYS